jgi:UDP-4-amino-4-deoxy-L-arabinose formyltransferase/UDP-glucuronic acid dehydrogenase (UDP-4-keto-hexauronic acid decarboxylating)
MEAVNIHPSLLPQYKGPSPTNWAIIEGEKETGVTIHRLTAVVDSGDILMQYRAWIEKCNDGQLRRKLYGIAAKLFNQLVDDLSRGMIKSIQMPDGGQYYPGLTTPKGIDLLSSGKFRKENIVRGVTPFPGEGLIAR